jgi:hypothetical protein
LKEAGLGARQVRYGFWQLQPVPDTIATVTRTENDEFQPGPSGGVSDEEAEHDRLFERLSAGMTSQTVQPELLKCGIFGREQL